MILHSIRIESWRCFVNPVQVGPFSDGLNVLHAPNATGKSTLFEALLRGLLDNHRVSGREVEALQPWGRHLAPSVTVEFSHGGTGYRLAKRFLDRPSSDLERRENGRFVRLSEGDVADQLVREILTHNPPGRGLARPENWGFAQILWASQGDLALANLSGDVVSNIRGALGMQVSGPGAGLLEERIEETYSQLYTPGGKLKAGRDAPPLVRLREQLQEAIKTRGIALEQHRAFEEATRKVEDLRAQRAQARHDAEEFSKTLKETRSKAELYAALLSQRKEREEQSKSAEAQHEALKQRIEAIKAARKEFGEAQGKQERLRGELPLRRHEVAAREKEAETAKSVLENVRKARKAVDEAYEEADLARRYLEANEKTEKLRQRLRLIAQATKVLIQRKKERGDLVAPDAKALRAIRKAIRKRDAAQTQLEAALITLEVVPEKAGTLEVVIGEEVGPRRFSSGRPTEVKGSPEVVVELPGFARLRAWGPSGSVEEVRADRDRAVRKLQQLTQGFSTEDLEELESLNEQAREMDKGAGKAETQLETLIAEDSVEEIEQERARGAAILDEILERRPAWRKVPPDLPGLVDVADTIKRTFITDVERAETAWEAAQAALAGAKEQTAGISGTLEEVKRQVLSLEEQIIKLTSDGKADEDRDAALKKLALSWEAFSAALDDVEKQLQVFGEDPSTTLVRLEKQVQSADEAGVAALEAEKREEGRLGHLSAQGPYSALARVEEEIAALEENIRKEELRTHAVQLLRDTVTQCRAEAMAAVAGPVELTATRKLQRIAGGRLGSIQLGESFDPYHVLPQFAEESVPLDNVSGGEQEQIYLATRLALAEVLAKEERQLVVLDDVLMATDAGRLARIMTILEEATQSLQILIITCHPERYRGLDGARFFDLEAILRDASEI